MLDGILAGICGVKYGAGKVSRLILKVFVFFVVFPLSPGLDLARALVEKLGLNIFFENLLLEKFC